MMVGKAVNDIINCRLLQSAQSSKPVDRDALFCTQLLDTKSKELIILHRFSPARYLRRVKDMIADGMSDKELIKLKPQQ